MEQGKISLKNADFRDGMKDLPTGSVGLVLTDPPYGKVYNPLWGDLAKESRRILKPGGFWVSYTGHYHLPDAMYQLKQHLDYYWMASVLHRTRSYREELGIYTAGKFVLIYQKPPRVKPPGGFVDVFGGGGKEKDYHPWQQPLGEAQYLIRCFSRPGELAPIRHKF